MLKVLFVKKSGRMSGGHIKLHDYFEHCLRHSDLDPYVYLAFADANGLGEIWQHARARVVSELDAGPYDVLFIDGRDWELLPPEASCKPIIHLIQDFRHGDRDDPRFAFLSRPALRICIGPELADAVRPNANGPVAVIPNGIDTHLFAPGLKEPRSVLIWARKDRELGKSIRSRLAKQNVHVRLLTRPIARDAFARILASTEVFLGLTKEREGFYLPALEAMASNCGVVCADAVGNRSYCLDGKTCRIARFGDVDDYLELVAELLDDRTELEAIRRGAFAAAQAHTLARERAAFLQFVKEYIAARSPVAG